MRLELPIKIMRDIIKRFKDSSKTKNPIPLKPNLFDDAKALIFDWLQTQQFPQFVKSISYIEMYNALANRQPFQLPDEVTLNNTNILS